MSDDSKPGYSRTPFVMDTNTNKALSLSPSQGMTNPKGIHNTCERLD
jgi:hypothetical protein